MQVNDIKSMVAKVARLGIHTIKKLNGWKEEVVVKYWSYNGDIFSYDVEFPGIASGYRTTTVYITWKELNLTNINLEKMYGLYVKWLNKNTIGSLPILKNL